MAAEDVRELLIRINASTELLRSNLTAAERAVADFERDTNSKLAKIDKNFGNLGASLERLKNGFASATGFVTGFVGALSTGAIIAAGRAVLDFADNLDAAAEQAGVSVERYQTLKEGLRALEVSGEQTDKVLKVLNDTLGSVQSGTASKSLTEALDRLGVTQDILNGKISDSGELLDAIAKGSDRYATAAQFTSDVVTILGRKIGVDLAAAIKDGGAALRGLEDDMRSAGNVISEEMVKKLADANEAIDAFKTRSAQTLTIWAGDTLTYFQNVMDGLQRLELRYRNFLGADTGDLQSQIDSYTRSQATPEGIARQRARVSNAQQQVKNAQGVADFIGGGGLIGRGAVGSANRNLQAERDRLDELLSARRDRVIGDLWNNWGSVGADPAPIKLGGSGGSGTKSKPKKIDEDAQLAIKSVTQLSEELSKLDARDFKKPLGRPFEELTGVDAEKEFRDTMDKIEAEKDQAYQKQKQRKEQDFQREVENTRFLTTLFEDGMRGGTRAIWDDFKNIGLEVLARLAAQFVAANLGGGSGGFNFGSSLTTAVTSVLGFGGAFASGGNPPVGKASLVGERGPELFVPKVPGTIIPNGGIGGGTSLNMTINAPGATGETVAMIRRELAAAAPMLIGAANQATMRNMSRRRLG